MEDDKLIKPNKGLHTDNSPQDQPKDTYKFALNGIRETNEGDSTYISNENSNELAWSLPEDFIPIGKEYITGNKQVIISISKDETQVEIGIVNSENTYERVGSILENSLDITEIEKFQFRISNQIDITYRLRRGCENTIYFTDGFQRPMFFNLSQPEDFYSNNTETYSPSKFFLQKTASKEPVYNDIIVNDGGGQLEAGSYNFAIQLLDEDFNPTEWLAVTKPINIYHKEQTAEFSSIQGTINRPDVEYLNFGKTSKSISLRLVPSSLDESFPFYRIAIIEATNGTGEISAVKFTDRISANNTNFTFSGTNFLERGTVEEIAQFTSVISSAKFVEQSENLLTLSNTKGSQINFCNLQKYASKIQTDAVTKTVVLTDINSKGNAKDPLVKNDLGYMPGELYSFGIVWKFENGETSPVFHIPGKAPGVDENTIFKRTGDNVFPMAKDNILRDTRYTDNSICQDYWGVDSEGDFIKDTRIRHHRFPTRRKVNLPIVNRENNVDIDGNTTQAGGNFFRFVVNTLTPGNSTINTSNEVFVLRVFYSVEGAEQSTDLLISLDDIVNATDIIDPDTGDVIGQNGQINLINYTESVFNDDENDIVPLRIEEEQEDGTFVSLSSGQTSPRGLQHILEGPISSNFTSTGFVTTTDIFGIQFSNIDVPTLQDTNGVRVVGYYIVRNERTDQEKTIVDSAAILPMVNNGEYTATGLLTPEVDPSQVSKNTFAFINPEYKFRGTEFKSISSIEQQGTYSVEKDNKSAIGFGDVLDGTSFDSGRHKGNSGTDNDGWSIWMIIRDSLLRYRASVTGFDKDDSQIKELLYFEGLESLSLRDEGSEKVLYNVAPDNKIGILRLEEDTNIESRQIPYVYFKRDLTESYSTFRTSTYFAVENEIKTGDTNVFFGGDNYVSPMRYSNTMFYENQIANRKGKSSFGRKLLGALATIAGGVLIATGVGAGAGVALIGAGVALFASGIKIDKANETYSDEIYMNLRKTLLDNWVTTEFMNYTPGWGAGAVRGSGSRRDGPADDTIKWLTDTVTDLWFDTQINTMLRHGYISEIPTHLNSPGKDETGNRTPYGGWEYFGRDFLDEGIQDRDPISDVERHVRQKLLVNDFERDDNVLYTGIPFSEQYLLNEDYQRINREKFYFHLPIEYDCCSDCNEEFSQRTHYSLQSFQEELTDNYRVFLPNNYRDLEGEKGEITDVFRFKNNLYIHTSEGLWRLPQNNQERVTDEIVSFIGTGDYFSIPPRLIVDDELNSGGCTHHWATIKTPYGVYFISDSQRKIYEFTGEQLNPISDRGQMHWFRNNNIKLLEQHLKLNGENYPFDNNPSNDIGVGYISAYDTSKKRLLITKQDKLYNERLVNELTDFKLITRENRPFLFRQFSNTVAEKEAEGFRFEGIEDFRLKFCRDRIVPAQRNRTTLQNFPNNADVIAYLDVSGSFDADARQQIVNTVRAWEANFRGLNPEWVGRLLFIGSPEGGPQPEGGGATGGGERWLYSLTEVIDKIYRPEGLSTAQILEKDVVIIAFTNESVGRTSDYHTNGFDTNVDGAGGTLPGDINNFRDSFSRVKSFGGISYPIHFGRSENSSLIQQQLGLLKGRNWFGAEFDQLTANPNIPDWSTTMRTSLVSSPIPSSISNIALENFGWQIVTQRTNTGTIISEQDFQEDINELLLGSVVLEDITVNVNELVTECEFVEGEFVDDIFEANNSFTISYDLKRRNWVSLHSYLPNFYYNISEKFYSWTHRIAGMWQHNILGKFGRFYTRKYPFIVEPVTSNLRTKINDTLKLYTEASRYVEENQEYVEERFITFDEAIIYNSRQCTGKLKLVVKDTQDEEVDYLLQQVNNDVDSIIIDKNEKDWTINDIRDIRIDYSKPIFNKNIKDFQDQYYIDKILNEDTLDFDKDWTQLESFRDKYLAVRLIFNNFEDVKLLLNFSFQDEKVSPR